MPSWPESLPQYFIPENFFFQARPAVIRTRPSVGPQRSRRRSTITLWDLRGTIFLTSLEEWKRFWKFYNDELAGGTKEFTWLHPYDRDVEIIATFTDPPPDDSIVGSLAWNVTISLEVREV